MTRRNYRQHTPKLTALILIPLIALAILGMSYSHWQETLTITGTITTGKRHTIIGSYKVLTPIRYDENRSIKDELLPGDEILVLTCANVSNCWNIYVGLKIHNIGTFTATIEPPLYTAENNTQDMIQHFETSTYYYGPYKEGYESKTVWADIKYGSTLPPDQGPSIMTLPGQTVIIWTTLHFTFDHPNQIFDPVTIQITLVTS